LIMLAEHPEIKAAVGHVNTRGKCEIMPDVNCKS
jgi:hypothetical protein